MSKLLIELEEDILMYAWNNGETPIELFIQDIEAWMKPIKRFLFEDIRSDLSMGFENKLALALAGEDYE